MTVIPPAEVHLGLDMEAYKALPALSGGLFFQILRSPKAFLDAKETPEDEDDADKYKVGTLAHSLILEGKDLRSLYAIKPEGMRFNTKDGKAWLAQQTLPILTQEESEGIPKMAEAIAQDKDASTILKRSHHREISIVCEIQGVKVKARYDALFDDLDGAAWIPDLKTCLDAGERGFSRQIYNLRYHSKAEWYRRIHQIAFGKPAGFIWIAVEKRRPYHVACWRPDEDMERLGHRDIERALNLYLTCRDTGEWPGYRSGVNQISLPKWALREDES